MQTKNRFRLRFNADGESGGSTPPPAPTAAGAPVALNAHGYPDGTPVVEMPAEQQAAYWKHKARKHERRARPDDIDDTVADAAKWRAQQAGNQSPDEKAAQDARDAGRREGAASLLHDAVRAELKAQRPHMTTDELDEFLEDVALEKFLGTDGRLDTDRVGRLAGKLATDPGAGGGAPPEPAPANGGQLLGGVLSRTVAPPKGNAGSVADYREREKARYAAQNTK